MRALGQNPTNVEVLRVLGHPKPEGAHTEKSYFCHLSYSVNELITYIIFKIYSEVSFFVAEGTYD